MPMDWKHIVRERLAVLRLSPLRENEIVEEVALHLEAIYEDALLKGLSEAEAQMHTLQSYDWRLLECELSRVEWQPSHATSEWLERKGGMRMESLWHDLSFGVRMLFKRPGFTLIAVITLALAIGANTAIFSLLDAVLLKPLPVKEPDRLFFLDRTGLPDSGKRVSFLTIPLLEQMRTRRDLLAGVCAIETSSHVTLSADGQVELAQAQQVSGSFFAVLGINAVRGRVFNEEEDQTLGGHPVAVISHRYWQKRFGGEPEIVGKRIVINNTPFTIIGVTPPEFFGIQVGQMPDLWTPLTMTMQINPGTSAKQYFRSPLLYVLARLQPGVTEPQAGAALTALMRQVVLAEKDTPRWHEKQPDISQQTVALRSASQGVTSLRARFSAPLRLLMAFVALVLLIACANVANLLSARALTRRKGIAVRLALGISRSRLLGQLLVESMLLAWLGGLLGLLFARWGSSFLLALVNTGSRPIYLDVTLDGRVLGFTAAVALLTSLLFGLAPAWQATRIDLASVFKDSTQPAGGGTWRGAGHTLVVVQVALSFVLLIGAGLFVRSFAKLKGMDAGINQENVLLVSTDVRMIGYQGRQIADLYQRMLTRLRAIPGVISASRSGQGLLSGRGANASIYFQEPVSGALEITGSSTDARFPMFCEVATDYFATVGMTMLRGRGFTETDGRNAPKVAVVNETFARHFFGHTDVIGKRFGDTEQNNSDTTIVGVVRDAKYSNLREASLRVFYLPYRQDDRDERETMFQIRTEGNPLQMVAAVRQALRELDANLPLYQIKTLAAQVDETLVAERLVSTLASALGLLSLLLAVLGLYSTLAYAVSQRTHEIGIRMALGAQARDVLRLVIVKGMRLVTLGIGLGVIGSFAATSAIRSFLYGVSAADGVTFTAVVSLLLLVALAACWIPAHRATRVDPLIALRSE